MNPLNLIGREELIFSRDMAAHANNLQEIVSNSSFLVIRRNLIPWIIYAPQFFLQGLFVKIFPSRP